MYTTDLIGIILTSSLYVTLTAATISLSQFQPISGFSQACQNAYNAPIYGCDASNFPQRCSAGCFAALAEAEVLIDNTCAGQQAIVDSIIGQMFQLNGPQFMCTSTLVRGSSEGSGSSSQYTDSSTASSSTTAASKSSPTTSSDFVTTATTESSSKFKSTVTTSSKTQHTSTEEARTSTSTSTSTTSLSSPSESTSTSAATTTTKKAGSAGPSPFLTTAFNNGQATTLTSQAQRTSAANSNPDAFGGGGSPFEVGNNGNSGEKVASVDFWLLLSVIFGVFLIR